MSELGPQDSIENAPDSITALENMLLTLKADSDLVNADTVENLLLSLESIIIQEAGIRKNSDLAEAARVADTIVKFEALQATSKGTTPENPLDRGKEKTRNIKDVVEQIAGLGWNGVWWSKMQRVLHSPDAVQVDALLEVLSMFKENEKFRSGKKQAQEKLFTALEKTLGLTKKQVLKKVSDDINVEIDLGVFQFNVEEGKAESHKRVRMTKSQLRYLAMINRHEQLREMIQHHKSNGYTQEFLDHVEKQMDSQDNIIIKEMIKFYNEYYDSVNEVYSRLYGVNLPKEDFYFPTKREVDKGESPDEFLKAIIWRGGVTARGLKSREPNVRAFTIDGDFATFESHLEEMEYFKAYAEKIRFLNSVFSEDNSSIMRDIREVHGLEVARTIRRDLDYFARKGALSSIAGEKFFRMMIRNFAGATLGLKPVLFMKQIYSQVAFTEDVSTWEFLKGLGKFYANPKKAYAFLNENSPFFRERGMGIDPDFADFLHSSAMVGKGKTVSWRKHAFALIQFGDKFAIAAGGFARYHALTKKGKTGKKATGKLTKQQALDDFGRLAERTQQSPSIDQQTELARGNAFHRVFTMFMTSHNAIARAEIDAIGEWRKGRIDAREFAKRIFWYHFFLPNLMQLTANVFQWDSEDQLQASLLGSFGGLFVVGQVLENAIIRGMNAANYEQKYFRSDTFHPLQAFNDLYRGIDDYNKKGVSWNDFVTGTKFLDSILDFASILAGGLPVKQAARIARGVAVIVNPDSSRNEREGAFLEILGWSPYAVDYKYFK